MRRPIRVLRPSILKVNIIHAEIRIPERRVRRHGIPRRARAREAGLERGRYDQHAGEDVVDGAGAVAVGGGPGYAHAVAGCVSGVACFAQEG